MALLLGRLRVGACPAPSEARLMTFAIWSTRHDGVMISSPESLVSSSASRRRRAFSMWCFSPRHCASPCQRSMQKSQCRASWSLVFGSTFTSMDGSSQSLIKLMSFVQRLSLKVTQRDQGRPLCESLVIDCCPPCFTLLENKQSGVLWRAKCQQDMGAIGAFSA